MYRNILVAIDSSDTAKEALRHAAELAGELSAGLTIVSVVSPIPGYAYSAGVDIAALERDAAEEVRKTVEAAAETVRGTVNAKGVVRHGHPGTEIAAQIEEQGHDLVVLGSRGRGRVASGLLGSVVGDVHFATRVPMLVIHPADND